MEEPYNAEYRAGRAMPGQAVEAARPGRLPDFHAASVAASSEDRLRWKTRFFLALVIVSQPLGNLSLTLGMKHRALDSPLDYLVAIFSPHVALGIVLLIVWLLSRMALLSWADLSYVLPITSVGYIITTVIARTVLHEQISVTRWSGTLLIVAGTALVGMTNANTAHTGVGERG
jgi:drug/metabolite transporter (DMT)-like permease